MIDRSDPQWYRDAIIYQVHVKSFFDANDDGVGDFEGLTRRLDYIRDLGATAIWVMPFYPSPLKDDGYDVFVPNRVVHTVGGRQILDVTVSAVLSNPYMVYPKPSFVQ